MAKEEKPLEYKRRIRDTKGVAQRLDLGYLKRATQLLVTRKRAVWVLVAAAGLACVPLVLGVGGSRKSLQNGPVSEAHAMFEQRCEFCHTQSFRSVSDKACGQCHDGAPHPAKSVDAGHPSKEIRCVECHVEHRGRVRLSVVVNARCTTCHAEIAAHSTGAKVGNVSTYRDGKHPQFASATLKDQRPLKLNHAKHMPSEAKLIRTIKLPMKCEDCHKVDPASPTGQLKPVTFEEDCKSCHARELEFDVDHVLGDDISVPAPHTKDARVIREFIWKVYADAVKANPAIARRPAGNDLVAQPNTNAWMERVVNDATAYLFGRKCGYCHETMGGGEVRKVNRVAGRYVEAKPDGEPWLARGEFSHGSHRGVRCEDCHTEARASQKTEDVLIPVMKSCTPCHGDSGTSLDDCAKCHQYHNRFKEQRRPDGPMEQFMKAGRPVTQ
jgi:hypothetical protein